MRKLIHWHRSAIAGIVVAKPRAYTVETYLKDASSGNVCGMGPAVAEMKFD